ncbi:hypothetical protein [Methylocystis sp.]|uniref:hypothetical protein n=1 Tax=Methylocystis sp. TaxID=1911079 RepID=UPI00273625A6|nr:hypothetical protein [Methylocystis sp.]MDP3553073.1 hypothetical protein [Methylocystis sp.]
MTDLSDVKARLHRLPLSTLIAMTWRLKLARTFLWLARVTDTYDGAAMRIVRRIVESAARCAVKCGQIGHTEKAPQRQIVVTADEKGPICNGQ